LRQEVTHVARELAFGGDAWRFALGAAEVVILIILGKQDEDHRVEVGARPLDNREIAARGVGREIGVFVEERSIGARQVGNAVASSAPC
jgi:hypothetical protein